MLNTMIRGVLVLGLLGGGVTAATKQPTPPPKLLIQISFPGLANDAIVAPDAYSGRVEVYQGDAFVGCAWAAVYEPSPGLRKLAPINLGYTAIGPKDTIHVEAFGELSRLGSMTVKISELNAATPEPLPAK